LARIAPDRVDEFHAILRRVINRWVQPDGTIALDWAIMMPTATR